MQILDLHHSKKGRFHKNQTGNIYCGCCAYKLAHLLQRPEVCVAPAFLHALLPHEEIREVYRPVAIVVHSTKCRLNLGLFVKVWEHLDHLFIKRVLIFLNNETRLLMGTVCF